MLLVAGFEPHWKLVQTHFVFSETNFPFFFFDLQLLIARVYFWAFFWMDDVPKTPAMKPVQNSAASTLKDTLAQQEVVDLKDIP